MSVRIDDAACCRCMVCVEDCPNEALLETVRGISVVDENCLDCGLCVDGCGNAAISIG